MRYGVLIRNPYDGKAEAVLGPYDTQELADGAMDTLVDMAERAVPCDGVIIHPDSIGWVIPVGGFAEFADLALEQRPSGLVEVEDGT